MAQSVKLHDEEMSLVRREAERQGRSLSGQIAHWIKLGRSIEMSGVYEHSRVNAALEGRLDTKDLTEAEEVVWLEAFTEALKSPTQKQDEFFALRRRLGRGVGLDAGGNLVYAKDLAPE